MPNLPPLSALFTTAPSGNATLFKRCLSAAVADGVVSEIIISFNGCSADYVADIKTWADHPCIRFLEFPEHKYLVHNVNALVQAASYEHVVWLADDCEMYPGSLAHSRAVYAAAFPDDTGIVGIDIYDGKEKLCAFPLTSKTYLRSLYGEPCRLASEEYVQRVWDSELADRARESDSLRMGGAARHYREAGAAGNEIGYGPDSTKDLNTYYRRKANGWKDTEHG